MPRINIQTPSVTSTSNTNLHPPLCSLTVFQKGAYYFGIKLFNHLSLKKSLSNKVKLFKSALKRFLNLHSFYSVEEYLEYIFNWESWFVYRDQWKCICNSSLIILNWIVYKCCIREIYCNINYSLATTRMVINMYDKKLFCIRYIYNNMTVPLSLRFF